jgi:hypothetical protein
MQGDYGQTLYKMESRICRVLFVLLDRYTKHCTVQQSFRRKLIKLNGFNIMSSQDFYSLTINLDHRESEDFDFSIPMWSDHQPSR